MKTIVLKGANGPAVEAGSKKSISHALNVASYRVMEKLGMQRDRRELLWWNGH
jgi:hypothetical protein